MFKTALEVNCGDVKSDAPTPTGLTIFNEAGSVPLKKTLRRGMVLLRDHHAFKINPLQRGCGF